MSNVKCDRTERSFNHKVDLQNIKTFEEFDSVIIIELFYKMFMFSVLVFQSVYFPYDSANLGHPTCCGIFMISTVFELELSVVTPLP